MGTPINQQREWNGRELKMNHVSPQILLKPHAVEYRGGVILAAESTDLERDPPNQSTGLFLPGWLTP